MRRAGLRWVCQVLARKRTAKAFAAVLCVSLAIPPQFGAAAELAHSGVTLGGLTEGREEPYSVCDFDVQYIPLSGCCPNEVPGPIRIILLEH